MNKLSKYIVTNGSLVELHVRVLAVLSLVHPVDLGHDVLLVAVHDDGRDGGSSLGRLLLELLPSRGIQDHVHDPTLVHIELAAVDEVLYLDPHVLGCAEVLLQVFVGLFELLDLLESSGQLGLRVALELLGLLDLLLGPSTLGRGLHQVR